MRKFQWLLFIVFLCGGLYALGELLQAQPWRPVRSGILFGISGAASVTQPIEGISCPSSSCFLVVHDNKKQDQGRFALIAVEGKDGPQYFPLNWPNNKELPDDLEAVTAVPGTGEPSFMASTSEGNVYHIKLSSDRDLSILKQFDLPRLPQKTNVEGFALQEVDGALLAIWGHRGEDKDPGTIYWGLLDPNTYEIAQQDSMKLTVPWPVGQVRHISDLKVNPDGVLYITSATDPGNDGPFQSAVYRAGEFEVGDNGVQFRKNSSRVPLFRLEGHKVEALELIPGTSNGIFLGSDDENRGGSIYLNW